MGLRVDRLTVFRSAPLQAASQSASLAGFTRASSACTAARASPSYCFSSMCIQRSRPKATQLLNTGTPVAGGFEFEQALFLIEQVVRTGRRVIGMDLNEVAPGADGEWDANVGARMLFRMCNQLAVSHGRA